MSKQEMSICMKNYFSLLIFTCMVAKTAAQIHISPVFGDKALAKNTWFVSSNGDSLQFDNIRFYLSNIEFETSSKSIVEDSVKAYLVDVFDAKTLIINSPKINFANINKLRFNVGIDSMTNMSGALGGDLDPMKGMYWAWQSGYINFKIEGKSPQCKNRKNEFQFHIGGYLEPFYSMRTVELELKNGFNSMKGMLKIDVSKFFENVHITQQNNIMIPCQEAMKLANEAVKMFVVLE
ncbi:MAG: hypothetical protein JNL70_00740 [Saprospiraceae bacterium]|nr:hypothetical protein [Saprospiraceae bacterium]